MSDSEFPPPQTQFPLLSPEQIKSLEDALQKLQTLQNALPSKPLMAYLVAYDLKLTAIKYTPLMAELQNSLGWWHYLGSVWIVIRTENLTEIAAKLRALIFKQDRLLIMPAFGPTDGWLPQDAWNWIGQNLKNSV